MSKLTKTVKVYSYIDTMKSTWSRNAIIDSREYKVYEYKVGIQSYIKRTDWKKMLTSWANAGEFGELFPLSGGEPVDTGMEESDAPSV